MPNKERSLKEKITSSAVFYTLLSIIFGFIVGAIALVIAGYNPLEAYGEMFRRIFGTSKTMSYSFIEYSTPYILTGLSVAFSFKTGVFNIGAEGQYVIGAVAAVLVGIFVKVPGWLLVPLCILAALLAGMIWGAIVGFLKVRFGVNEVLSMIMFNWIAYYFSNFIVNLKSVEVGGGKTWTKAKKSPFVSPLAPMTLQHIPGSNNILAVWTEDKEERNPLVIAVVNEKLEFISKQILDKSGKDPALWYCYSAILPLDDNRYLISYCAGLRKNWGLDTTKIVIVDMSE